MLTGRRGLFGTLLKRYLKPGGSGIFLVDIHCYDPPEWCALARRFMLHLRNQSHHKGCSAAPWQVPTVYLCVLRSLLVTDAEQIQKGRETGVRTICPPAADGGSALCVPGSYAAVESSKYSSHASCCALAPKLPQSSTLQSCCAMASATHCELAACLYPPA